MSFDPFAQDVPAPPQDIHPGAMACFCLSPDQQEALRAAAGLPGAEADHITLVYLAGDAEEIAANKNALLSSLAQLAQATPPLSGEIGGVARFAASESSDGQDVCVALYDCPDLPALHSALCDCLAACGIVPSSDHGFTPHITLAYIPPDAPMPVEALPRMPLSFDCLSLVWAGERIELPFQGGGEAEGMEDQAADLLSDVIEDAQLAQALLLEADAMEGGAPKGMKAIHDGFTEDEIKETIKALFAEYNS